MSRIYERIATAIMEGDAENSAKLAERGLKQGLAAKDILDNGMVVGMGEVGVRFKAGDMFVPEVLMSADAMQSGLEVLRPELVAAGVKLIGKILMGTVKGDLHDIGKNLVGMMCEGAGFEVHDIGKDIAPEDFVEAVKEHDPDIVGMSALLTTTMRSMESTIKVLEEAGVRDKVKIMIGGAPVTQAFADEIGADGYAPDAAAAADLAKEFVASA
jgi:5-methyltetrahydrofolate--homocysteine methyltransferase